MPGRRRPCAANGVVVSTQRRKGARAQRLKLGLVTNFGERLVKDGIHRDATSRIVRIGSVARDQRPPSFLRLTMLARR